MRRSQVLENLQKGEKSSGTPRITRLRWRLWWAGRRHGHEARETRELPRI